MVAQGMKTMPSPGVLFRMNLGVVSTVSTCTLRMAMRSDGMEVFFFGMTETYRKNKK